MNIFPCWLCMLPTHTFTFDLLPPLLFSFPLHSCALYFSILHPPFLSLFLFPPTSLSSSLPPPPLLSLSLSPSSSAGVFLSGGSVTASLTVVTARTNLRHARPATAQLVDSSVRTGAAPTPTSCATPTLTAPTGQTRTLPSAV